MSALGEREPRTAFDQLVDSFAADLHMIAQATGLADRARVLEIVHDVRALARRGFLTRIDIVLMDAADHEVRAASFHLSDDPSHAEDHRPGGNLWPALRGGSLRVVLAHAPAWWMLSTDERCAFVERHCCRRWEISGIDTSHPGLAAQPDRCYAVHDLALERIAYVST
jgi:hypothetical protein